MSADLEARIERQVDFPSPPHVAAEVIGMARNPDVELGTVATAIGRDPAMAAKIMRIANSAFYAQRRRSSNIKQALVVIGLNAALTLALSFSLVSSLRGLRPNGIDYGRYWRRTLLAATASRAFAETARLGNEEDCFLAGLLQDVAVLAIDRSAGDFYRQLPPGCSHAALIDYEQRRLGKDHAQVGAKLLKSWNLPDHLVEAVALSHQPELATGTWAKLVQCVALGSLLADTVFAPERPVALVECADRARALLGIRDEQFTETVARVFNLIPEAEQLYETSILDRDDADSLLAQARELLTLRNLQALQEVSSLKETASRLLSKTEELEDASKRDPLTGTLNRMWLDRMVEREFTQAVMFGRSLSVALVDLDHFRTVNEHFGHAAGDKVLQACAQALTANVRGSDLVGRYGGEEFLIVFPGTDREIAQKVCERIVGVMSKLDHPFAKARVVTTVSVGIATFRPQQGFANAHELLSAADHALYAAKLRGRNCVEYFDDVSTDRTRSALKSA